MELARTIRAVGGPLDVRRYLEGSGDGIWLVVGALSLLILALVLLVGAVLSDDEGDESQR